MARLTQLLGTAVLVVPVLALAGCAPQDGFQTPFSGSDGWTEALEHSPNEMVYAEDGGWASDTAGSPAGEAAQKIAVSGEASVLTDDPAAAASEFAAIVTDAGGVVDSTQVVDEASYRSAWVQARVPAESYETVLEQLRGVGKVESERSSTADLGLQFTDLEARKVSLEDSIRRFEELAESADNTQDLLQAEELLSQQRAEYESLVAQLKWLEDEVAMSSLSVDFNTEPTAPGPHFSFGWVGDTLAWSLFVMAWLVVAVLPWAAVGALLVWWRRRRKARAAATRN